MTQAIRFVTGERKCARAGHPRRSSLLLIAATALAAGAISGGAASPAVASDDRRPTVAPAHERSAGSRAGRSHWGRSPGYHRGYYRGFYYRPSFYSAWYWPGYYYRPYGPYLYDGYWGSYYRPDAGALDLDIRPEKASIYLDGELIGVADNYDGWPRYLWLREGSYRLVVYHEGYETLAREVRIRPGEIISLKDRMQAGPSKRPEELFAEAERARSPAARRAPAEEGRRVPYREEDWRDRSESPGREPPRAPDVPERDRRDRDRAAPPLAADQRSDPARLHVVVSPADAVVYLDGRLLGSGEELARLHSDLIVDPGTHSLEVARPGYRTYSIELELEAGELRELRADLEPQG